MTSKLLRPHRRTRNVRVTGGRHCRNRLTLEAAISRGAASGRRYFSAAAHQQLTSTQTGELKTGFTEGMSWGFGFQVVKQPTGVTAMLAPGTYGHGGAYGTQSWADPKRGTVYILMIQRARMANGDASDIRKAFQETAAETLK